MSKIISIATGVPEHKHEQSDLFSFADKVYNDNETDSRKLRFLYRQSGIGSRYSVAPDFSSSERSFFPDTADLEPFPTLETRMQWFNKYASPLSVNVISDCISGHIPKNEITHLITVSCTGMSAPGLDLQIMEAMELAPDLVRSSVNFMGCYAAVHALKLADAFCDSQPNANVVIVCTELCTLHFQKEASVDNLTSSLLFGDGSAAVLVQSDKGQEGLTIDSFFSDVSFKGKKEMAWELSSKGFLMTLTGYVPELIKEDFEGFVQKALDKAGVARSEITDWCIHPGGKKILEAISGSLQLQENDLKHSYAVLQDYGNMSSPTILFVLQRIMADAKARGHAKILGAAFGPGLTMETFIASYA
ncbi:MAG: type polyketide synthase [Ferruginibacter sp.]|nr:type polyketide synthase [Ferruginibacter sp.]